MTKKRTRGVQFGSQKIWKVMGESAFSGPTPKVAKKPSSSTFLRLNERLGSGGWYEVMKALMVDFASSIATDNTQ